MSGNEVNWYTLRRMTPLSDPSQKDNWAAVEISPDSALALLSREVGYALHFCADDEPADFVLDRRHAVPASCGTGFMAGDAIEGFFYVGRGEPLT
jgi:hypothetical protein